MINEYRLRKYESPTDCRWRWPVFFSKANQIGKTKQVRESQIYVCVYRYHTHTLTLVFICK